MCTGRYKQKRTFRKKKKESRCIIFSFCYLLFLNSDPTTVLVITGNTLPLFVIVPIFGRFLSKLFF